MVRIRVHVSIISLAILFLHQSYTLPVGSINDVSDEAARQSTLFKRIITDLEELIELQHSQQQNDMDERRSDISSWLEKKFSMKEENDHSNQVEGPGWARGGK